ncbi:MAG: site-2 protease family protein [Anaerolineales bacterium]|jgi:Zn-dependent protease
MADTDAGHDIGASERLLSAVEQVMQVDEVTRGSQKQGFSVRFRGRLMVDSQEAYDRLEGVFTQHGTTLVFRKEGEDHLVLAIPGVIQPRPSNPYLNLLVFVLTVLSVLFTGAMYSVEFPPQAGLAEQLRLTFLSLPEGIPFAASLLAILLAHEFAHYIAARRHNTAVSLPYFLPFPLSPFGTMGAVILMKQPPRTRRAVLDIGLAGPLAGLVVAIPVLILGLSLSEVGSLPVGSSPSQPFVLEGNSLLYLGAKYLTKGELLPAPVSYGGLHPLLYWARYLFLGQPVPYGGRDVMLHPVAWAGWAGLLITAVNLIPLGQLDGGHIIHALLGRRAATLRPFILVAMVGLGFVWSGWWLWAALLFFLGRSTSQPLNGILPLDRRRKALAVLGLIVFILVFTPVPLNAYGGY